MCRVLRVGRSGYQSWVRRLPDPRAREDAELSARFRDIHEASDGIYGNPRIHTELRSEGCRVGRNRVAQLMCQSGLSGVMRRRGWKSTTRSQPGAEVAPDRVGRQFEADRLDVLWVVDAIYVSDGGGDAVSGYDPRRLFMSHCRLVDGLKSIGGADDFGIAHGLE